MSPNNLPSLPPPTSYTRRGMISRLASGLLLYSATGALAEEFHTRPGTFAEALTRTAWVEEGPFYPYRRLPLDTDNDLLIVNDSITPAVGEVTYVSGKVLDSRGEPVRNARLEIWQCDSTATYLAERDRRGGGYDGNFQGFGRFVTGSSGEYCFRTIKPIPYPGRPAPHIHFKVYVKDQRPWTTQLFIQGYPGNFQDGIYRGLGNARNAATVTKEFTPIKGSRAGELAAGFDIILGFTSAA